MPADTPPVSSAGAPRNRHPFGKTAVLFDLGGTLVEYFGRADFPGVLKECIGSVRAYLEQEGIGPPGEKALQERAAAENFEAEDGRVRPLEDRLQRIFRIDSARPNDRLVPEMCDAFVRPIFQRGRLFEDAVPALEALKSRGIITAIVSNTTWGSPAGLWREEVARRALTPHLDAVVFCRDVGWRKPAPPIFDFALTKLNRAPAECIFVGDDPRWDVAGPRAVGMDALLLDRSSGSTDDDSAITRLSELLERLPSR